MSRIQKGNGKLREGFYMRILYMNDELATGDGSNYHALGIFKALQASLGESNVRAFPAPADGSGNRINHKALVLKERLKFPLQIIRIIRKNLSSRRRAGQLIRQLEAEGFLPTHILSRTVLFDTTALRVSLHFHARLISEFNAPMYYEHGLMGGLPLKGAMERWERKILIQSDLIYTVSDVCRDMLCTHYHMSDESNISKNKFLTIPNGYMSSLFTADLSEKESLRRKIRTQENFSDKFVVTFVGSLKKWHGIDSLCGLADYLKENKSFHFLVIGDGSEHNRIEAYCRTHDNMTYKGKLSLKSMSEYLYASDLGIMPYHKTEAFYFSPLKLYDMIGAGLPFIGTDQGQIAQICRENLSDDFLFEDCRPELMAQKLLSIASHPEIYQSMKDAVLKNRESMSWEARTADLLKGIG